MMSNLIVAIALALVVCSLQTLESQATVDTDRIQRGLLRDIRPASIEELTKGADVVVRAHLVKARTFLADEIYIRTEYEIRNPEMISGAFAVVSSPKPDVARPFILAVFGGEMTINGQTITAVDHGRATEITSGREYLMFLRRFGPDPRQYQLHNGAIFEIEGGQAKALAKGAETVYKGMSQAPVADLIERVRAQGKAK